MLEISYLAHSKWLFIIAYWGTWHQMVVLVILEQYLTDGEKHMAGGGNVDL